MYLPVPALSGRAFIISFRQKTVPFPEDPFQCN